MKYVIFSIFLLFVTYFLYSFLLDETIKFVTPFFFINFKIYKYISIFIFIIVELSIFMIYINNNLSNKIIIVLIINYIFFLLFIFSFFYLKNTFFLLIFKLIHFYSSLSLNEEVSRKNKTSANILAPYVIWTFYLTLVSISIFFINNS